MTFLLTKIFFLLLSQAKLTSFQFLSDYWEVVLAWGQSVMLVIVYGYVYYTIVF